MNAVQSSTPSSRPRAGSPPPPHAHDPHGADGPGGAHGAGPHAANATRHEPRHEPTTLERATSGPTTAERLAAGRTTHERLADRDDPHEVPDAVVGRGGAAGREAFVTTQARETERIGRTTAPVAYEGPVLRAVDERYGATYANHDFSDGGGRYNRVGHKAIYNAETLAGAHAEAVHYTGLDSKRIVTSTFVTERMLDVTDHPRLTAGALMEPYGDRGKDRTLLSRITGEDPYLHPRALSDGARAAEMDSLRVPANGTHVNVNVIPENAPNLPEQYAYDHHAMGGASDAPRLRDAEVLPPPVHTRGSGFHAEGKPTYTSRLAADTTEHARAGGLRYAAVGSAAASTLGALSDGRIDRRELGGIAGDTALGTGAAFTSDALASRLGHLRGGAIVDGAISIGASTLQDADAVANGTMSAGDATADVAVDAGVAVSSGVAGMAAGAAVGSVVPIVGTAAGAVVGFGVGVGGAWLAGKAIEASGVADAARERLGDALESRFEASLQKAWGGIDRGIDGAKGAVSGAVSSVKSWFGG